MILTIVKAQNRNMRRQIVAVQHNQSDISHMARQSRYTANVPRLTEQFCTFFLFSSRHGYLQLYFVFIM
jgi:hypothetical protein